MLVKIGPRGQVTIPKQIRRALAVGAGDSLAISIEDDVVVMQPVKETLRDLRGSVKAIADAPTFDEARDSAKAYVSERHENKSS